MSAHEDPPGYAPEAPDTPLPDLHEAMLDEVLEEKLFTDVGAVTELLGVFVKGGPTERASGDPLDFAAAVALWRRGEVRALQLRYRFESVEWFDTLMRTPKGTRLVRVGHRFSP